MKGNLRKRSLVGSIALRILFVDANSNWRTPRGPEIKSWGYSVRVNTDALGEWVYEIYG